MLMIRSNESASGACPDTSASCAERKEKQIARTAKKASSAKCFINTYSASQYTNEITQRFAVGRNSGALLRSTAGGGCPHVFASRDGA